MVCEKKKTIIYLVIGIIVLVTIGTIIYFAWPKNKPVETKEQKQEANSKQKIQSLQTELSSLKSKLSSLSNNTNKSQLENKFSNIESQVNNLSSQEKEKPTTTTIKKLEQEIEKIKKKLKESENNSDEPNKDKNDEPNEDDNPNDRDDSPEPDPQPDNDDLFSSIFKWNGSIKQGYWLFENPRQKIKVNIAETHPFLKGKKLDSSDDTPPFAIRFKKNDVSKQEEDNTFYFDEDNTNFEINPFGGWDWLDDNIEEEEPQNSKKEVKVKFIRESFLKDYAFSDNKIELIINKNHSRIKELLKEKKLQKDKEFIIRYGKIDKESVFSFFFNEDNQELEIMEV